MEVLSRMLSAAVDGGQVPLWFLIGCMTSGDNVSHLLYGDDTLLLCWTNSNHLLCVCALFKKIIILLFFEVTTPFLGVEYD